MRSRVVDKCPRPVGGISQRPVSIWLKVRCHKGHLYVMDRYSIRVCGPKPDSLLEHRTLTESAAQDWAEEIGAVFL